MSALAAIIKEPANNLKRWDSEAATKLHRAADATVLFTRSGSGVSNTVQAGVAAIPWTSGFGNGDPAPTTDGTIDLTDYGPWMTFILAQTNGATAQMYVTQWRNWTAVAGPAGGRTVVALDIIEFLRTRYAGPELAGDQALEQSGRYTASGGVAVAASTNTLTRGDFGVQHIAFPTLYDSSIVPALDVTSQSADYAAAIAQGEVIGVTVTNGGSGYTTPPTVAFSGGGGSGARARAIISGGVVTEVVLLDLGVGYTAAPSVAFSGGGGTGAAATASVSALPDNTGFDVIVRRTRPLTAPLSGELDLTIPMGQNAIDAAVSFGVTYDAAPVVAVSVVNDPSGVDGESQYQPALHDRSTTGFFAVIFHMPHPQIGAVGHIITSPNDDPTSPMYGTANVNPASAVPIPTGGVNGSPVTGGVNLVSGVTPVTGNPNLIAGVSPITGDQSQGHVHPENPIPGNTGDEDRSHHHDVGGHQHNEGAHDHNEGAHDHNTGDHVHRLNNHDHTVDVFPDETADRTLTVGWTAFGRQHADATHVPVSWVARG